MPFLDPRLLRITMDIGAQRKTYADLAMTVTCTKFANPNPAECNITIANVGRSDIDFILTEGSPFNPNRDPTVSRSITVEVGRESTGLNLLYTGDIHRTSITQPPDALISIRALTKAGQKGNILARNAPPVASLSFIAQQIANDLDVALVFEATDIQVANYAFTGPALRQVEKLQELANINVYIDNNELIVKDENVPRAGRVRRLSAENGMIGVPNFTDRGANVTALYDNQTVAGGELEVVSVQYPALTGRYFVYKLNYTLTNRDTPFYYVAECRRVIGG